MKKLTIALCAAVSLATVALSTGANAQQVPNESPAVAETKQRLLDREKRAQEYVLRMSFAASLRQLDLQAYNHGGTVTVSLQDGRLYCQVWKQARQTERQGALVRSTITLGLTYNYPYQATSAMNDFAEVANGDSSAQRIQQHCNVIDKATEGPVAIAGWPLAN